jgi:hypothetical protein
MRPAATGMAEMTDWWPRRGGPCRPGRSDILVGQALPGVPLRLMALDRIEVSVPLRLSYYLMRGATTDDPGRACPLYRRAG